MCSNGSRDLQLAYSEGQIGWIPYVLDRADKVWAENRGWGGVADKVKVPPSEAYREHVFGCFFDDPHGLKSLDEIGVETVTFETDYPHSDSTWPHSRKVAMDIMDGPRRRDDRPDRPDQRDPDAATRPAGLTTFRSSRRQGAGVGSGPEIKDTRMNQECFDAVTSRPGFIAALDQSGGSTPKALKLYGVDESEYSNDDEMFDRIHEMRTRIITSPAFDGDRILGAILFEGTMDREIEGKGSADYLWNVKKVVPFLKVDKGLAEEADGVQVMKPMPDLDELLERAVAKGVFGTKMRSVIKLANPAGVRAVVDQQFAIGRQILAHGLVPIIEPEIDIHSPEKAAAEDLLQDRDPRTARQARRRPVRHAEADAAGERRLLRGVRRAPAVSQGRRAVRRLLAGGGERAAGAQPRHDRELLAGAHRRAHRRSRAPMRFDAMLDASIQSIFEASRT